MVRAQISEAHVDQLIDEVASRFGERNVPPLVSEERQSPSQSRAAPLRVWLGAPACGGWDGNPNLRLIRQGVLLSRFI